MVARLQPNPIPLRADRDGVLRVGDSRVTLDVVVAQFLSGETAEDIAQNFSALSLADVYATIAYYLAHRTELDAYLQARHAEAAELRRKMEAKFDPAEFRMRLMLRKAPDGTA